MDNIQSNSQESLLKDKISKMCPHVTALSIYELIDTTVAKYSLDYDKVAKEILLSFERTEEIRSVYAFVNAVIGRIVSKRLDEFTKDWKEPNFLSLHLTMDKEGFKGELWEKTLIDKVETHALNEFPIDITELIETNHAIINYCKEKTYAEFLDFLLRSKLFKKVNIPLEQLTEEAKREADEWNALVGTI